MRGAKPRFLPFLIAFLIGLSLYSVSPPGWGRIELSGEGCEAVVEGGRIEGTCEEVKLSGDELIVKLDKGSNLVVNGIRVFPRSFENGTEIYRVKILRKTKLVGFLLGFSVSLYVMATRVSYVITSIFVIFLCSVFGIPENPLSSFSSPVVFVFLAGSAFELAMRKTKLDTVMARHVSGLFRSKSGILFAILLVSSLLSAVMSNTAATYVMVPVVLSTFSNPEPILISLVSATAVGGSLTIIGTPPNLIVSVFVEKMLGKHIGFSEWLRFGFPVWAFGLAFVYLLALMMSKNVDVKVKRGLEPLEPEQITVLSVIVLTVILWTSSDLNSGVVGLFSIALLLVLGVLKHDDVLKLRWDLVLLFTGGLTLGRAMLESGYAQWLVGHITPPESVVGVFSMLMTLLVIGTVFSSHTSASALIGPTVIPLGMGIAARFGENPIDFGMKLAVLAVLSINTAMALPISTPPSAIVFSTGKVKVKNLLLYGIAFGIAMNTFLVLYFL